MARSLTLRHVYLETKMRVYSVLIVDYAMGC